MKIPHRASHAEKDWDTLAPPPNALFSPRNALHSMTGPLKMPCLTSQPTKHRHGPQHQTTPRVRFHRSQTLSRCTPVPASTSPAKMIRLPGRNLARNHPVMAICPLPYASHLGDALIKPTIAGLPISANQHSQATGAPRMVRAHYPNAVTYPCRPLLNEFTSAHIPAEAQNMAAECTQIQNSSVLHS